jgi:hypothetical protein
VEGRELDGAEIEAVLTKRCGRALCEPGVDGGGTCDKMGGIGGGMGEMEKGAEAGMSDDIGVGEWM